MARLEGKKAVIVGAGKKGNMGYAIAERFLAEGAKVAISGRSPEPLSECAEKLGATGVLCDITDKSSIQKLADEVKAELGGIDIVVNASGWAQGAPFCDVSEELLDKTIDIQFKGPFQLFQVMLQAMNKGGSLIQISSATAKIMSNDYAPYMSTKAAIDHVIRIIANEFGGTGIRANSISPGLTKTAMTEGVFALPGLVEAFEASYPLGRIGTVEDVAAAAVWLASDECFMSGENLQVSGGVTLRGFPTREVRQIYMDRAAAE